MGSHGDSVLESGRATAVQPSGAAALLFSRQEAHAILRPRSGRIRARCELVGRSQLWPEELTFKRKTGRKVPKIEVFNGLGRVPLAQWISAVDPVTAYHRRAAPCARIIHLVTCRSQ